MIPHPLIRNTVIPFFIIAHLTVRNQKPYQILSKLTLLITPICFILMTLDVNPWTWIIYPTWRSMFSILQYLIYITYTDHTVYGQTGNRQTSYTYAILSATAAGYLYEVPMWLNRGPLHLIRTSQYSLILFDFGLIALIYLLYVTRNNVTPKASLIIYLCYVIIFTFNPNPLNTLWYQVTHLPTVIMRRIPAMILTKTIIDTPNKT